jgi:hypothetical protein
VGQAAQNFRSRCPQAQAEDAVARLDLVYATGTTDFGVDLARIFGTTHAPQLACAV